MLANLKKVMACAVSLVMILSLSACGEKEEAEEKGDFISGCKWVTTSEMLLNIETDGTFKWYKNKNDRTDNYYSGDIDVYVGQKAVDFLNKELGSTEEAQLQAMSKYAITLDEYYVLDMVNKECIEGGTNTLTEDSPVIYTGYYLPEYETLKIINMAMGKSYEFSKM